MIIYLILEDLLVLAEDLEVGPIRDAGLLDAAAHRPRTRLWGTDAYPSLHEKAAALLHSLLGNHPLADGNERLGWLAVAVFYDINCFDLEAPDDDVYDFVISIADGSLSDVTVIAAQLQAWSRDV